GDGSDIRAITGLGFMPGYVMILPEPYNQATQRFPSQTGDASIRFGASNEGTNWIQAFLPDGFEVGTDSLVNAPGLTYHYIAWNDVAGITAGGLHAGNGFDNWDITGLGFQPDYVLAKQRASSNGTVHRPSSIIGDNTLSMRQGWLFQNGIQAFLPDGFQVGTSTSVNEAGSQYDWFAFRNPSLPVANLALTMAVSDSVPIEGDTLNYTITLVNNGPDGASGVQLIDLLPAGVSYLSDAPSQGTYTSAAGLWDVGAILVSDSATLHVLAAVDLGTVDQTIVNSATIASANQADPDTTDNSATASITVGPSEMRVASGSYTGDGADDRAIAGIGFEPDVVIVKGDLSESALVRTSTMNGDVSRELGEKSALLPDLIQSLDPDGFTVGTSDGVNKPAVTYYWTA
ncbi:MAG: DUF11 domain-containing protein, partial [Candidatus Krumholzibacteria bacterium]|nr:DUF11 domain-containing protein [Candidatus Krumholzibacteria bacterium]